MSIHNDDAAKAAPPSRKYANYFQAGFNEFEFVIDFGEFYADQAEPVLHTGFITSPEYAQRLCDLLKNTLRDHRDQFGTPDEE
jgi:flagellum-specific peptidoglycan hydrolase FlgJ